MPTDMQKDPSAISITLSDLLAILKTKLIFILIATVLFGVAGVLFTQTLDPTYTATSMYMVYAHPTDKDGNVVEGGNTGNSPISSMTSTQISISRGYKGVYMREIQSSTRLPRVVRTWMIAHYGYTEETAPSANAIKNAISISSDEDEYFLFNVTITTARSQLSDDINRAFADVVSDSYKQHADYLVLKAAANSIAPIADNNLEEFKNALRQYGITCAGDAEYIAFSASLSALLERLTIAAHTAEDVAYTCAFIDGSDIFFRDASILTKVNPVSNIYIVISIFAGFILSYLLFLILKIADTKIRTEEDLASACGYPVLASIPAIGSSVAMKGEEK